MSNRKLQPSLLVRPFAPEGAELIGAVYDAALKDGNWSTMLDGIRKRVHGNAGILVSYDFRAKTGRIHHSVGLKPGFFNSYADNHSSHDVWLRRGDLQNHLGMISTGEQYVTEIALVRSEFYRDWLAPQGLFHSIFSVVLCRRNTALVCMMLRSEPAGPFGVRAVANFEQFVPHLLTAMKMHENHSYLAYEKEAAFGVLDRLPIGVIMVTERGEVIETNRYADDVIGLDDGLHIRGDIVSAESQVETQQLHDLVLSAARPVMDGIDSSSETLVVTRPSGMSSFTVIISPLTIATRFLGERRRIVAIYITDPERRNDIDQEMIQDFYGLTPAEARLACQLAQGLRLEDAAEIGKVSLNTMRTHLRRIFCKTGTDRQADLVRLILSGPAQMVRPVLSGAVANARKLRALAAS